MDIEERKERALGLLRSQLPTFRWAVGNNVILTRDELIEKVGRGSEEIIELVIGQESGLNSSNKGIMFGRRYKCLVCGTEALCTKAGSGCNTNMECCGQDVVAQVPRPLPSSD